MALEMTPYILELESVDERAVHPSFKEEIRCFDLYKAIKEYLKALQRDNLFYIDSNAVVKYKNKKSGEIGRIKASPMVTYFYEEV